MDRKLAKTIVIAVGIVMLSFVVWIFATAKQANDPAYLTQKIQELDLAEADEAEMVGEARDMAAANALSARQVLASSSKDKTGRIILNDRLRGALIDGSCLPEVDSKISVNTNLSSNQTVQFIDTENGVKFPVPYNEAWLGNSFALAPFNQGFIEKSKVIHFGAPIKYGLCNVEREFSLTIGDTATGVSHSDTPITTQIINDRVFVRHEQHDHYINVNTYIVFYTTEFNGRSFTFGLSQEGSSETADQLPKKMETFLRNITFFEPSTLVKTDFFSGENVCARGYYTSSKQLAWYQNSQYRFGLLTPVLAGTNNVPPYEVTTTPQGFTLGFGDATFVNAEGCTSYRQYHLTPIPARTGEQIKTAILQTTGDTVKRVADEKEVWSYYEPDGQCHQLVYEVVGRAYNYKISENHCASWDRFGSVVKEIPGVLSNVVIW